MLKKLFDVAVNPAANGRDCEDVVIVLADGEAEARSLVSEFQSGLIASVTTYGGQVSAVGPSRIVGRFRGH